jgi:hypothetical protein
LNCLFLITGFKLWKSLSVVCEFGWQTYICKNYIQNICSVLKDTKKNLDQKLKILVQYLINMMGVIQNSCQVTHLRLETFVSLVISKTPYSHILLTVFSQCCYRRFGHETIHPTQKFTSVNLLQIPCVTT